MRRYSLRSGTSQNIKTDVLARTELLKWYTENMARECGQMHTTLICLQALIYIL